MAVNSGWFQFKIQTTDAHAQVVNRVSRRPILLNNSIRARACIRACVK